MTSSFASPTLPALALAPIMAVMACQPREPPTTQQVCEHVMTINQRELPEQLGELTPEQLTQSIDACVAELDARAETLGPALHAKIGFCLMAASDLEGIAKCDPEDF